MTASHSKVTIVGRANLWVKGRVSHLGSATVPTYLPMIIALISFRISFKEGMVDGIILSNVCL